MIKNWTNIHPAFTEKLKKEWEDKGFDYHDCKGYINKGLKPEEADFANYLYYQGYYFYGSRSWTNLSDEDIAKQLRKSREEYNALWKNISTTAELAFQWQNTNFTYEQTKKWLEVGLQFDDYEFAAYLRWKSINHNKQNLDQLRTEFNTWWENLSAQEYLDCCYPKIKRKTITILDVREKNLTGSLDLSDFVNLEVLDGWGNKLTALKLDNCRQLRILNCNDNQLVNLDLNNLDKLEGLRCGNNYLSDLVISPFQVEQLTYLYAENNNFSPQDCSIFRKIINLRELCIGNHDREKIQQGIYNRFSGSLESLRDLSKLEYLDISNTDIDSGLECLQDSVQNFSCSTNERPDSKVKILEQELKKYGKSIDGNFAHLLQLWKPANSEKAKIIQLEQTENLTNQLDTEQQPQILQRESIVPSSSKK